MKKLKDIGKKNEKEKKEKKQEKIWHGKVLEPSHHWKRLVGPAET